jgi:ABC-type spermidine/putrescine transport system permease subunit II
MMRLSTPATALLSALAGAVFLLLYGPLVIPIASSFFEVAHGNVQWHHPSLSSYAQLAANAGIIEACKNTFIVGVFASLLALICGTLFALHYCSGKSLAREAMQFGVYLPFLMPPIITGLSLLIFFRETDIPRSLITVIVAHTVFVQALAYRTVVVRLQSLGLGLLPNLSSTLVGAGVLSFALSFDETMITLLVTGTDSTLPIRLWAMMRLGFTPDINALVALILLLTFLLCVLAIRQLRPAGFDA